MAQIVGLLPRMFKALVQTSVLGGHTHKKDKRGMKMMEG
jgi:hypothetical protein